MSSVGLATDAVIVSAYTTTNSKVFANVLALHVPRGSIVADVTHGKGSFWLDIAPGSYQVKATDIQTGVDCRSLPYDDESIDCVVLDPPYIDGFYRPSMKQMAHTASDFRERYSRRAPVAAGEPLYHAGVLDMYFRAGREAFRVLKEQGVLIVKCQDEVSNHIQELTHVQIINEFTGYGLYAKDLFVVVRRDTPHGKRIKRQVHARKNHSYFLIFTKRCAGSTVISHCSTNNEVTNDRL